ncbi:MAG: GH25 family lysozyme [Candidatus Dormiibacterota bacterium]
MKSEIASEESAERRVRSTLPQLAPILTSSVVLGCDVSAYQGGSINWAAAYGAGVRVAYVQFTQGTGVKNPYALTQVEGARAAGISVGPYHMCYPALNNPQAEVSYFRSYLGSAPVNLPAMLDDEEMGGLTWAALRSWVRSWFAIWGDPKALHYSDQSYLAALGNVGQPQWTARPGATGLHAGDYATQFASAPLAGFKGDVDLDYFDPGAPPKPTEEEDVNAMVIVVAEAGEAQYLFVPNPGYKIWLDATTVGGLLATVGQAVVQQCSVAIAELIPTLGPDAPGITSPKYVPGGPSSSGSFSSTIAGTIEDQGAGKSTLTGTATPAA